MQDKKVFCLIGERCKSIKYAPEKSKSDAEIIRRKLLEASQNDAVLSMMMSGKSIVLQKKNPDRDNKLCDIEDDEEIPDLSDLTVLLYPSTCSVASLASSSSSTSSIIISDDLDVGAESAGIDFKVLYTELAPTNLGTDFQIDNLCEPGTAIVVEAESQSQNQDIPEEAKAGSSAIENIQSTRVKRENLPPSSGPGSIPRAAPLPPLCIDLEKRLEDPGILQAQKYFIHHWGSYLWQATETNPTKQDYYNLASSIVAAYPSLRGGQNECGIVKSQLSIWIRNHRANLKKQSIKRDNQGKAKIAPVAQATVKATGSVEKAHTDVENALKEIQKKYTQGINVSHMKKLLQVTLTARRPWIENEASRIVDIGKRYPLLNDYEMMFAEFLMLKNKTEDVLFEKIDSMLQKLATLFSIQNNSERSKALILQKLCEELSNKKLKKKNTALFIVQEVMTSTTNLCTGPEDAPRVVMYIAEEDIATAYIVADEDIRIKIPEPTVRRVVAGLLSSYFVWHRAYPSSYFNTLQYIEHEILETSLKNGSTVITKFIRKLNQHSAG